MTDKKSHSLPLKFKVGGNAKLGDRVVSFSLPSGFTCPGAKECLSKANPDTGKITDGAFTRFRCFSATQESAFRNVRNARWHNFDILAKAKTQAKMAELLIDGLDGVITRKVEAVRVHVAGDFFSQVYFDAWMEAAQRYPDVRFYAYTKSLQFWIPRLGLIPKNFSLIASAGGKQDKLIEKFKLPHAVVVFHPEEAAKLGLEVDHDDRMAMAGKTFALLVHGTQPAGSSAAAALKRMDSEKIVYSYSRESKPEAAHV